jgi:hypothetical protein
MKLTAAREKFRTLIYGQSAVVRQKFSYVKQNEVNCISVSKATRPNIVMSHFVIPLYNRRRGAMVSKPQARANV